MISLHSSSPAAACPHLNDRRRPNAGGCSLPLPHSPNTRGLPRTISPHASRPPAPTRPGPILEALIQIETSGVIACLRAPSGELAVEAARAALSSGLSVLEIVMPTPGVLDAVKTLSLEFPSSAIGVGTVLTAPDARDAVEAGAKFLMSPATITEILTADTGVLYIPGAMTPTEVISAYNSGAKAVKIYPISVLGGVEYLSVLKKPFPHIPMVASQGVGLDSVEPYLNGGASAVVLSDAIFGRGAVSVKERDLDAIRRRAKIAASSAGRSVRHRQAARNSRDSAEMASREC